MDIEQAEKFAKLIVEIEKIFGHEVADHVRVVIEKQEPNFNWERLIKDLPNIEI